MRRSRRIIDDDNLVAHPVPDSANTRTSSSSSSSNHITSNNYNDSSNNINNSSSNSDFYDDSNYNHSSCSNYNTNSSSDKRSSNNNSNVMNSRSQNSNAEPSRSRGAKRKSIEIAEVDDTLTNAPLNNMPTESTVRHRDFPATAKELAAFDKLSDQAQKQCVRTVSRLFIFKGESRFLYRA